MRDPSKAIIVCEKTTVETILENIMSLLDFERIPSSISHRIKYLATKLDIPEEDVRLFFSGQQALPKGAVRHIAELYEVELNWLTGR